jgi:hypothetical protein
MLRVQGNAVTGRFAAIRRRLGELSPAYTAEQIARGDAASTSSPGTATARRARVQVQPPDSRLRRTRPLTVLRLSVPSNWGEVSGDNTGATYAPVGGYAERNGTMEGFTHGIQVGVSEAAGSDLRRDTNALIATFARANPDLRQEGGYARQSMGSRAGLGATLSNVSSLSGERETVSLSTVRLADGRLLYLIGVAPQAEARVYEDAFRRIRQSAQINDR